MEERIIAKVYEHEFLYNVRLSQYRDNQRRKEAWEQIGRELNVSATECKETWGKLRNCLLNALKRRRSASNGHATKFSKWKYEDQMAFLMPFLYSRQDAFDSTPFFETSKLRRYSPTPAPIEPPPLGSSSPYSKQQSGLESSLLSPVNNSLINDAQEESGFLHSDDNATEENSRTRVQTLTTVTPMKTLKLEEGQTTGPSLHGLRTDSERFHGRESSTREHVHDETEMFYISMARTVKRLPVMDQAKIRMELCRLVSEAEIRTLHARQIACTSSDGASHSQISSPARSPMPDLITAALSTPIASMQQPSLSPNNPECKTDAFEAFETHSIST
ncbi:uncharacterized protein LOC105699754 [Orussus abietinus]|uniref:uncharacterized protein LOC105699754 n=1 Tax=Orussus abietinus TaxID=222816 RepID=UPI000626667D|nr:uncharacterized protein LOC105699754 [Orussus abietinus]